MFITDFKYYPMYLVLAVVFFLLASRLFLLLHSEKSWFQWFVFWYILPDLHFYLRVLWCIIGTCLREAWNAWESLTYILTENVKETRVTAPCSSGGMTVWMGCVPQNSLHLERYSVHLRWWLLWLCMFYHNKKIWKQKWERVRCWNLCNHSFQVTKQGRKAVLCDLCEESHSLLFYLKVFFIWC